MPAVTKAQIAALDETRLRLIEMSDLFAVNALAARINELRKYLEYQEHVLVAMEARRAMRRVAQPTMSSHGLFKNQSYPSAAAA